MLRYSFVYKMGKNWLSYKILDFGHLVILLNALIRWNLKTHVYHN